MIPLQDEWMLVVYSCGVFLLGWLVGLFYRTTLFQSQSSAD